MESETLLPETVVSDFSDEIARLEELPTASYRDCLASVSRFIESVSYALERRVSLPTRPLSLTGLEKSSRETYRDAFARLKAAKILLERYEEDSRQWRYFALGEPARLYQTAQRLYDRHRNEMRELVQNLRSPERLFVVRRLWKPGIFNVRELSEFMGQPANLQSYDLKRLVKLGVIEKRMRATYVPGPNAQPAMQMFAVLLLLWRRTMDSYLDLPVRDVQRRVTHVLGSVRSLSGLLEAVRDLERIPDAEPIVVLRGKVRHYLQAASLRKAHLLAVDTYMDRVSEEVSMPRAMSCLFRAVQLVSPDLTIKEAETQLCSGADPVGFSADEKGLWYFERPVF